MNKTLIAFALASAASLSVAKTAAPSGPTVPYQPKDTSVFKDTDGTCYSRVATTFGRVVECPKDAR